MSTGPTRADVLIAQALARVGGAIQATTFLAVASLVVMAFDTIITFDQEVKFVWRQQWSFGKAMFLFIRHFATLLMIGHVISMLLYDPSLELCHTIEVVFVWSQVAIVIAGSSVLVVRTWLLCGGDKWILACLILGLIGVTVPSLFFVASDKIIIIPNPAPALLPGCLVRIPSNSWRPFVFPLIYETAILCITFIKAFTSRSRTPILMRLFRDGTVYYVTVVAVLLVTVVGATNQTMRPIVLGSGYHIASVSIGCSRLILSLHAWSEAQNQTQQSSCSPSTRHSTLARKSLHLQSPVSTPKGTYEYELKARKPSDIESASTSTHTRTGSGDTIPPPVPPKDSDFQSLLPDIERPSLPERMWSTLPGAYNRQQQHRPYSRPPRSSSLYASGQVPDRLLLKTATVPAVKEFEEPEWKVSLMADAEQRVGKVGSGGRYNVI